MKPFDVLLVGNVKNPAEQDRFTSLTFHQLLSDPESTYLRKFIKQFFEHENSVENYMFLEKIHELHQRMQQIDDAQGGRLEQKDDDSVAAKALMDIYYQYVKPGYDIVFLQDPEHLSELLAKKEQDVLYIRKTEAGNIYCSGVAVSGEVFRDVDIGVKRIDAVNLASSAAHILQELSVQLEDRGLALRSQSSEINLPGEMRNELAMHKDKNDLKLAHFDRAVVEIQSLVQRDTMRRIKLKFNEYSLTKEELRELWKSTHEFYRQYKDAKGIKRDRYQATGDYLGDFDSSLRMLKKTIEALFSPSVDISRLFHHHVLREEKSGFELSELKNDPAIKKIKELYREFYDSYNHNNSVANTALDEGEKIMRDKMFSFMNKFVLSLRLHDFPLDARDEMSVLVSMGSESSLRAGM